jgi:hypothetical protein
MEHPLKWHELSVGSEYIISHTGKIHDKSIYKGTFIERHESRGSRFIPVEKRGYGGQYEIIITWYSLFSVNGDKKYFFESDIYYDLAMIKQNAMQAREKMEKRALDKILKQIVNEEFQW